MKSYRNSNYLKGGIKGGKRNRWNKEKINSKMVDFNQTISILNVNIMSITSTVSLNTAN